MGKNNSGRNKDQIREDETLERQINDSSANLAEKDRIQRGKINYYRENRSELIRHISKRIGRSKAPAISGLIAILPVFTVGLVIVWLFNHINNMPGSEFLNFTGFYVIDQTIKLGMLLIFSAALVTSIGRFVRTPYGFRAEKVVDNSFDHIPFLGAIYSLVKVTTETVLTGAEDLSEPVKVEFDGLRLTAFKTGNISKDGRPIIFLPTAPNITTGLVIEIDPEKIVETGESAEEALTRTLSAGFGQKKQDNVKKTV